jgi:hypothetical protein
MCDKVLLPFDQAQSEELAIPDWNACLLVPPSCVIFWLLPFDQGNHLSVWSILLCRKHKIYFDIGVHFVKIDSLPKRKNQFNFVLHPHCHQLTWEMLVVPTVDKFQRCWNQEEDHNQIAHMLFYCFRTTSIVSGSRIHYRSPTAFYDFPDAVARSAALVWGARCRGVLWGVVRKETEGLEVGKEGRNLGKVKKGWFWYKTGGFGLDSGWILLGFGVGVEVWYPVHQVKTE